MKNKGREKRVVDERNKSESIMDRKMRREKETG